MQVSDNKETYIFWSGGKDSTATICLAHELGLKIDGVVMSEVMFDHKRNISGENPEHIKWIYDVAIPIIENEFGYKVIVLRDKSDYLQEFNKITKRSCKPERIGKKHGYFLSGKCKGNDVLKMRPIRQFVRKHKGCTQIVGIALDEPHRAKKKTMNNKRSLLIENKITESMCYEICRKYNLLSPIYNYSNRGGCWFCPNAKTGELARLKKEYPNLWNELVLLSQDKNLIKYKFNFTQTIPEIEKDIDLINNQMNLFDLL
jgi:3'-phosphoadenosine 5'-phosphosulfate sulfotransferase (PAPS reductase)/FAD synthetase